ncbi:MAG: hypothetical protein K5925_03335 [Bacilli bacterium]|nr:hypothetical protein [Bacilli bacterium]
MKNKVISVIAITGGLVLSSCGGSNTEDTTKERIVTRNVFSLSEDQKRVESVGTLNLLFKANGDIPYISLKDGLEYINLIRHARVSKDSSISLKQEENKATYTSTDNAQVVIDMQEQSITYNDFTGFLNHVQPYKDTYSLLTPFKGSSIHLIDNKYEKGNNYTVSLKNYSQIDIYKHGNDFYMPLTTYNDLFINPNTMTNLVYNFERVYLFSGNEIFSTKNDEGEDVLTTLGKSYYSRKATDPTVSKEYAEYFYQNICLNFDYLYGVKGLKGREYTTFDNYLSTKGYKTDLLSGNVKKMDAAYAYALSALKDFHTVASNYSPLYEFGKHDIDVDKYDAEKVKEEKEEDTLNLARVFSGASLGFSVDTTNKIAYIAFNNFSSVDEKALSKSSWTEEDLDNSATLFAHAYKEITTKYLGSIDYVAVDLATNDGGAADGMAYMLGILLGRYSIEIQDPCTGAHAKSTYAVDINRDGKVDEGDISLREYGKKIVFIDSHFTFSCGNALPVFAKLNYPSQVTAIGETTGGGTCVVRPAYTALGSLYNISGIQMLSKRNGEKLVNIEDGVTADIPLNDVRATIDRNAVAKALLEKK